MTHIAIKKKTWQYVSLLLKRKTVRMAIRGIVRNAAVPAPKETETEERRNDMKKEIRAVQIDLARQKETLEQIFRFFRMAAEFHYNTVVLYLEDRIRTATYPWKKTEESYTEEEIREMVRYADALGLELIPAVSNFSHTESFLEHEELAGLAELRGNVKGRFTKAGEAIYITACPLLPESQAFFDTYYAEVAACFPSKYFLAGLDEDFDIGHCELCKADVEAHSGIGHLFLHHVIRTNQVLNRLGKEMLMFDDMFWFCPEILPEVPKNIIMCTWNYDYIDRFPRCQFGNSRQADLFGMYDRLGIRYIMTGWANFTHNIDTFTKYAAQHSPIGYLNTTWQMTAEQLLFTYPLVAYAGLLWGEEMPDEEESDGGPADEALRRMKRAVMAVCGVTDARDVAALCEAASKPYLQRTPNYYLQDVLVRRNVNFDDEYRDVAYNYEQLKAIPSDNEIVSQIRYRAKRTMLLYEEVMVAQELLDMRTGIRRVDLKACQRKLNRIRREMLQQYEEQYELWSRLRAGIPTTALDEEKAYEMNSLDQLTTLAQTVSFAQDGVLDMVVLLPEKTTLSRIGITVRYEDGEQKLPEGIYKMLKTACYNIADKGPYLYTVSFVIDGGRKIEELQVDVRGFGNTCIAYLAAYSRGTAYVPVHAEGISGRVEHPEHLLAYDTRWCSIGHYDMLAAMKDSRLADEVSSVIIRMEQRE